MPGPSTDATLLMEGDGHPSVLAYRMGQVESKLDKLGVQLESISNHYPTLQTVNLLLEPIKTEITEIKAERKADELAKNSANAQLRLAIVVAAISPIFSVFVTLVMGGKI